MCDAIQQQVLVLRLLGSEEGKARGGETSQSLFNSVNKVNGRVMGWMKCDSTEDVTCI